MNTTFEKGKGEESWITPPDLVKSLGHFDLDPCGCLTQPFIYADKQYTIEDNGLMQQWEGRVWCNPPYGRKTAEFIAKLSQHGNGILLIFARVGTKAWFNHIWNKADAILFLKGRISFYTPEGVKADPAGCASCLVAYGKNNVNALSVIQDKGKLVILKQ